MGIALYAGRVAVDPIDPGTGVPACFSTFGMLSACTWVTSQADLEQDLDLSTGGATDITVTAPVINAPNVAIVSTNC